MAKKLPYWRVDDNLISIDFPQNKTVEPVIAITEADIKTMEAWANEILNSALSLPTEMVPYHGAGVDGVPFGGKFD